MTTIKQLLKTARCKVCGNIDIRKFTIYFKRENERTTIHLYCEECQTHYQIPDTKNLVSLHNLIELPAKECAVAEIGGC